MPGLLQQWKNKKKEYIIYIKSYPWWLIYRCSIAFEQYICISQAGPISCECTCWWGDCQIITTPSNGEWKEMSHSSKSPSNPAVCLAQPHPAIECWGPWEPLSSPAWELFPGPPSFSSPRHSYASHGSWQYEDFGRELGGSRRLHAHYWKHTFVLLPGTRQMSAESGCEKSPQQSKDPSHPLCFCAKQEHFCTEPMYKV